MSSNVEYSAPKEHPVNLYFGSTDDMNDLKSKDNASQAYLIMQNNQLYYENSKLRLRIEKMKVEAETLSTDIESMDKTKTCLKGLLHNEIEINRIRDDICEVRGSDARRIARQAYILVCEIYATTCAVMLLFAAREVVEQELHEMVYLAQILIIFGNLLSTCVFTPTFKLTQIPEIEEALKKAEKGSENLHSIIDEL